jgi:hypothetical protein
MALMPLMKDCQGDEITDLIDVEVKMKIPEELKTDILTSTIFMSLTVYGEDL